MTISANHTVLKDTAAIIIGNASVVLAKIDSLHYGFVMPVVAPGIYNFDLSKLNAANTVSVTVANYTPITNPDAIIEQVKTTFNNLVDSLKQNSFSNSVSSVDIAFMHQIMNQVNENIKALTPEQKLLTAYQLQQLDFDTTPFHQLNIDTSYLAKIQNPDDEPSQQILDNTLLDSHVNYAVKAAGVLTIGSGVAWVSTGCTAVNLGVAFLGSFGAYVYLKSKAKSLSVQLSGFAGIAKDNLIVMDGNGTTSNPVQFTGTSSVWQKLQGRFRTIQTSDKVGTNTNISDFINSNDELQTQDGNVKQVFDKARNIASIFFGQINSSYDLYISPVLSQARAKVAAVKKSFISIANVSNSNIQITASDDGTNGLKISATNPSNNLTTETAFTFQLVYTQTAINNTVTVTEQAKFIPLSVPKVTTTAVSAITQTTASSGGIITSDGGSPIISKGICYGPDPNPIPDILNTIPAGTGTGFFVSNITGLQPGKIYHLRAFASNSVGIGYGDDVSFTTLSATKPVLITSNANSVTAATAVSGGNITDDGGASITSRGVCWSTSHNPTIALPTKTSDGTGTGSFTSNITGLDAGKTYYVSAYATNSAGTAYGNEVSFTTSLSGLGDYIGTYNFDISNPGFGTFPLHLTFTSGTTSLTGIMYYGPTNYPASATYLAPTMNANAAGEDYTPPGSGGGHIRRTWTFTGTLTGNTWSGQVTMLYEETNSDGTVRPSVTWKGYYTTTR